MKKNKPEVFTDTNVKELCIPYQGYKHAGEFFASEAEAALAALGNLFDSWYIRHSKDKITYDSVCGEESELNAGAVRKWLNANCAEITAYLGKYASLQEELKNAKK